MSHRQSVRSGLMLLVLGAGLLCAADFSQYRGLQLGSGLATVAQQANLKASDVQEVHQRPALIQELELRMVSVYSPSPQKAESVRDCVLRFYNGQLFQIVSTYDAERVEGLTTEDMVEAISAVYGTAGRPAQLEVAYRTNYGATGVVLARWENADYAHSLVRSGDKASYALLLTHKRLDALARTAIAESGRLDKLEEPQRAQAEQKKIEEDKRLLLDKARAANLRQFRP